MTDIYTYIDNYEQFSERVKRFEQGILQDGIDIGMEKGRKEEREKADAEKALMLKEVEAKELQMVLKMKSRGLDNAEIAELTNKTIAEIN